MLSDATYEYLASTSVLKDFVELPSQLMEHWLSEPVVLKEHAKHYQSGAVLPDDLIKRFKAAELFNEGFNTIEYTSCAMYDIALHSLSDYGDDFDLAKFEQEYLEEQGMPQGIIMRHRPPHFLHLFASSSCELSVCYFPSLFPPYLYDEFTSYFFLYTILNYPVIRRREWILRLYVGSSSR